MERNNTSCFPTTEKHTKNPSFNFSPLMPDIVLCSVDADSEKGAMVLCKEDICADLPFEIRRGGLSRVRRIYLYKTLGLKLESSSETSHVQN